MLKRLSAIILSVLMVISAVPAVSAAETQLPSFITEATTGLFVHGADSATDTEAWQMWQSEIQEYNEDGNYDPENYSLREIKTDIKYFFMPNGSADNTAVIYNGYDTDVTINETVVPAKDFAQVIYSADVDYKVTVNNESYTLIFKKSTAEAAIYINNPDADGNGTELYDYLSQSKDNSASATAALVGKDGSVDNTSVKKIKGRGNTTWKKNKKPFNVTYTDKVSIDGMQSGKKFSLLANYQDGSLVRNRLLYDLSDEVGMPYASDSRFADLYMNGVYYGSYQIAQKIEVGSSDLINDIDDEAYLNADGTVADNFPFVMEIDPSASSDDYTVKTSNKTPITIKSPEIGEGETGYEEVKTYVSTKFTEMYRAITTTSTKEKLEAVLDIDSFSKLYLINEISKNWDVGVASVYFTYKQDADGNWKFFASPVWDYDNSIGNAKGVESDFNRMDITQEDYTSPTGWWVKYKSYSSSSATFNIMCRIAKCQYFQKYSSLVWFKDFVPAIEKFSSLHVMEGELYSWDIYYNYLVGSADCNYTRGWALDTNDNWITDHSSLFKGIYDSETKQFVQDTDATTYEATFRGEYEYTIDWFTTRCAWLTAEFLTIGDTNGDGTVNDGDNIEDSVPGTEPTESIQPSESGSTSATTPTETEATSPSFTQPTEPTESTVEDAEITVNAPVITKVKAKSSKAVKINWQAVEDANGYLLYQKKAGGKFTQIKDIKAGTASVKVTGLASATKYSFKLKAYKISDGNTYYSNHSNTKTVLTQPDKVVIKKAKALSANSVKLTWKKVKRASGYAIYVKQGSKFTKIAEVGKKKKAYTVNYRKPSTKYTFKVRAFKNYDKENVYGKYSKPASAKTYSATYNKYGYYKLFTSVPDFGKYTNASLSSQPVTVKEDGSKVTIYFYYPETIDSEDLNNYYDLLEDKNFKYYGSGKLSDGNTILYYTKDKTFVSLAVTGGYFTVACTTV